MLPPSSLLLFGSFVPFFWFFVCLFFFDICVQIRYQAASPDEATLVDAARNLGFFFHVNTPLPPLPLSPSPLLFFFSHLSSQTRNPRDIICNIMGEDVQFQILNVLEFNSTRKRMSVITKDSSTGTLPPSFLHLPFSPHPFLVLFCFILLIIFYF